MFSFFFFNDTATTEIYTLSLHDALPICEIAVDPVILLFERDRERENLGLREVAEVSGHKRTPIIRRSEEHTSELQSPCNLVCRLLLEKKNHRHNVRLAQSNRTTRALVRS